MLKIIYQLPIEQASIIKDYYKEKEYPNDKNIYLYFHSKVNDVIIDCYKDKKANFKIIYMSNNKGKLLKEAKIFNDSLNEESIIDLDETKRDNFVISSLQIGSDEVGKGDFFGPLVIVSSYVDGKTLKFLEELNVTDSKKISDEKHLEIGKTLKSRTKNYTIVVSAKKLSSINSSGININKTLAILHNMSHKKLIEKYALDESIPIYVDQFESLSSYKTQVGDELVKNNLFFHTQGENHYPSVALSSCIARYLFLSEWKKMEEKLGCNIPKGASAESVKTYNLLRKKYSKEELSFYVKTFFKTYKEVED